MKILNTIFLSVTLFFLSGCSVYKAASNEGVKVKDIKKCGTKSCLISHGLEILEKDTDDETGKYIERYKGIARKSGFTYARAAGHGVLDAVTLGLWEVVGTPVEGAMTNNRGFVTVVAIYPKKGAECFEKITMYDNNGQVVFENNFNHPLPY